MAQIFFLFITVVVKIISGGQTGVDQAALQVAIDLGLEHGGWCPPGRICESGQIPAEFRLKETPQDYSEDAPSIPRSLRTQWNVRDSDATLIIVPHRHWTDSGTQWTETVVRNLNKPCLKVSLDKKENAIKLENWISSNHIEILNVAGPSEGSFKGIYDITYDLLIDIFKD